MADDLEELARAAKSDKACFDALVHRSAPTLMRFLRGMARANEDVDDLSQEVFLALWDAIPKWKEKGKFTTFLYGIALRVTRRHQRRERVREIFGMGRGLEDAYRLKSDSLTPEAEAESSETVAIVRQAVAELPPKYREIIVLREWEGQSYEEIARILNIPKGSVMSRLSRARERLARTLKKTGLV